MLSGSGVAELLRDGAKCDKSGVMWRRFLKFHQDNPWVYECFLQHCRMVRNAGFRHYSAHTIMYVMRYEYDLRTGGEEVPGVGIVKLNNNHTPYYSRLVIENHPPMFWDFFELRTAEGDPTNDLLHKWRAIFKRAS